MKYYIIISSCLINKNLLQQIKVTFWDYEFVKLIILNNKSNLTEDLIILAKTLQNQNMEIIFDPIDYLTLQKNIRSIGIFSNKRQYSTINKIELNICCILQHNQQGQENECDNENYFKVKSIRQCAQLLCMSNEQLKLKKIFELMLVQQKKYLKNQEMVKRLSSIFSTYIQNANLSHIRTKIKSIKNFKNIISFINQKHYDSKQKIFHILIIYQLQKCIQRKNNEIVIKKIQSARYLTKLKQKAFFALMQNICN